MPILSLVVHLRLLKYNLQFKATIVIKCASSYISPLLIISGLVPNGIIYCRTLGSFALIQYGVPTKQACTVFENFATGVLQLEALSHDAVTNEQAACFWSGSKLNRISPNVIPRRCFLLRVTSGSRMAIHHIALTSYSAPQMLWLWPLITLISNSYRICRHQFCSKLKLTIIKYLTQRLYRT